ncbi:MAG: hypothetical protein ABIG96_06775 [Candidatus Micrarchaeota archaeon]
MAMKFLLMLVFSAALIFGCLQIDSKKSTPTPEIIYVNVSPQIIVTVQPTVVPTVTERVVYASPSFAPPIRGGVEDFGERVEYLNYDISKVANADYHHNPFLMLNAIGQNFYPELKEGTIRWKSVPFTILPDYLSSRKWSVITTASEDFYSASFLTGRERISILDLLVAGNFRKGDRRLLATVKVNYEDGDIQEVKIMSNENVWNYEPDEAYQIPNELIAWQAASDTKQTLTVIEVPIARPLTPVGGITIKKEATGENGFALFAATGVKKFRTKKITHTQYEFQNLDYNRIYSTTLSAGATINYDDSSGSRVYRPEGIFESPIIDGETDLVLWKSIAWESEVTPGTAIKVQYRTGSNPVIDTTWNEWSDIQNNQPISRNARLLQWRAVMTTFDSTRSPLLTEMRLTYENPA